VLLLLHLARLALVLLLLVHQLDLLHPATRRHHDVLTDALGVPGVADVLNNHLLLLLLRTLVDDHPLDAHLLLPRRPHLPDAQHLLLPVDPDGDGLLSHLEQPARAGVRSDEHLGGH
jgi:hypothetical protein